MLVNEIKTDFKVKNIDLKKVKVTKLKLQQTFTFLNKKTGKL